MAETKVTYTEEGFKKLQEEYDHLVNVERQQVKEELAKARAFGDLSENSEYDEAKDHQAKVEGRIIELKAQIENAVVIKDSEINHDVIHVGNVVTVYDKEEDEELEYTLVSANEIDAFRGMISQHSPIGEALLDHRIGDVVTVKSPNGDYELEIRSFRKANN